MIEEEKQARINNLFEMIRDIVKQPIPIEMVKDRLFAVASKSVISIEELENYATTK